MRFNFVCQYVYMDAPANSTSLYRRSSYKYSRGDAFPDAWMSIKKMRAIICLGCKKQNNMHTCDCYNLSALSDLPRTLKG